MRIGIIADAMDDGGAGIASLVKNVVEQLLILDKKNTYVLVHHSPNDHPIFKAKNVEDVIVPVPSYPCNRAIRKLFHMRQALNKLDLDVVHDPGQMGPFFMHTNYKSVITINDLVPLILPKTSPFWVPIHHRFGLPPLMRKVDKIMAISESTKNDIHAYFPAAETKVEKIMLGANDAFKPASAIMKNRVKKKYKLNKPFFIIVSTIEPRKNMIRIIRAFDLFKQKTKSPIQFVIVGGKGWNKERNALKQTIKDLKLTKDVKLLGHVPFADLPALYSAASGLVFATLYEGFGLPILEAQACGCPVITSAISSMPEVAGDSAILVNPYKEESIAQGMEQLLKQSASLKRKGFKNVKRFSWKKTATELLKLYKSI